MILAIIRIILISVILLFICIFGLIYCLINKPRHPNHVFVFGRLFGSISHLFGIKVEIRYPKGIKLPKNCIYIANHQTSYDMITVSYVIQPHTVTIGKKSIIWIPLFGILYWLSGNILIDRKKFTNIKFTIHKIIENIKKRNISVWIFPEGTRSRGKGLLPFKSGAFYVSIIAKVPIVPICVSNTFNKIKLNRLINGLVIIEVLSPIDTCYFNKKHVHILTKYCWNIMENKIKELNEEVNERELISFTKKNNIN